MEILAGIGVAAKELFDYNREMYQFDQDQRLDRELLRLELQIKRFDLFREDIRCLVELTVGKMKMYHVVGALFLSNLATLYAEGRVKSPTPPFLLALYWMSVAGSWAYVMLAVWLSMHASVTSHSIGVRLLTRFVRLPIPGAGHIEALSSKLADFERQGLQIARLPGLQAAPHWEQCRPHVSANVAEEARGDQDAKFKPGVKRAGDRELQTQDLLGQGESPQLDNNGKSAPQLPGQHIQLFRKLQAKWQCYDAYARVSMCIGAGWTLMSLSFFVTILCTTQYYAPSTCFALLLVFQSTALAVTWLDVSGTPRWFICVLKLAGALSVFLSAMAAMSWRQKFAGSDNLRYAEQETSNVAAFDRFPYAFVCFILMSAWLSGVLYLAKPSNDLAALPRKFRTVLFLDVFAMAEDREKREEATEATFDNRAHGWHARHATEKSKAADEAMSKAVAALRRWEAVPDLSSEGERFSDRLKQLRAQCDRYNQKLSAEARRQCTILGDDASKKMLKPDRREWQDLSLAEQADEPFAGYLLGPFEHQGANYFYNVEGQMFEWHEEGNHVLTMTFVEECVRDAQEKVQALLRDVGGLDMDLSSDADGPSLGGSPLGTRAPGSRWQRRAPERLPWVVLKNLTRILIMVWATMGFVTMLTEFNVLRMYDFKSHSEHGEEESGSRRLSKADFGTWHRTQQWEWPQDRSRDQLRFQCVAKPDDSSVSIWGCNGPLVEVEDSSMNTADSHAEQQESLADLEFPCLMAAPVPGGLSFWRLNGFHAVSQAVTLPLGEGIPSWQLLAGAVIPCSQAANLLVDPGADSVWCLLLAGWDGQRLPIAILPLPSGPKMPPQMSKTVVPIFDVPLSLAGEIGVAKRQSGRACNSSSMVWHQTALSVVALHLEPNTAGLWAVLADGNLLSWDLPQLHVRGRWAPGRWDLGGIAFQKFGACDEVRDKGLSIRIHTKDATGDTELRAGSARSTAAA